MRVLVTGATGLVGRAVVDRLLEAGHEVLATSRHPPASALRPGLSWLEWDGEGPLPPPGRVGAIVHLAGEPVIGKRWTKRQKQRLQESRIGAAQRLVAWIKSVPKTQQPVLVCANAVGYYGARPVGPCPESRPAGEDFLAALCAQWQAAAQSSPGRVVVMRFGHVLGDGGYLGSLVPFARFHLGGPIAGGKQPMPWVHVLDVARSVVWAIDNPKASGAYNVVSPGAVGHTQKEFARALALGLGKPFQIPVPAFGLGLRYGFDVAPVLTGGQDVVPARVQQEGFAFEHAGLDAALQSLVGK